MTHEMLMCLNLLTEVVLIIGLRFEGKKKVRTMLIRIASERKYKSRALL